MKTLIAGIVLAAVAYFLITTPRKTATMAADAASDQLLVHNVYFSLNDNSPANVKKLVEACDKYLTGHPGTVFYAAGTLCDLDRPVNDRGFDVGLHVIFQNRAAHDQYQTAPRHLQFIEENKATWKQVRVFDSDCAAKAK